MTSQNYFSISQSMFRTIGTKLTLWYFLLIISSFFVRLSVNPSFHHVFSRSFCVVFPTLTCLIASSCHFVKPSLLWFYSHVLDQHSFCLLHYHLWQEMYHDQMRLSHYHQHQSSQVIFVQIFLLWTASFLRHFQVVGISISWLCCHVSDLSLYHHLYIY